MAHKPPPSFSIMVWLSPSASAGSKTTRGGEGRSKWVRVTVRVEVVVQVRVKVVRASENVLASYSHVG